MHKFDLQRALAGEPLITRDGRAVTDFHLADEDLAYPYEGMIDRFGLENFTATGSQYYNGEDRFDLFMLHETSGNASDLSATQDPSTGIATGTPVESGSPSWQPIETAPRDGTEILGWDGSSYDVCWFGWKDGDSDVFFNGDITVEPTRWMPLPAPPTA